MVKSINSLRKSPTLGKDKSEGLVYFTSPKMKNTFSTNRSPAFLHIAQICFFEVYQIFAYMIVAIVYLIRNQL